MNEQNYQTLRRALIEGLPGVLFSMSHWCEPVDDSADMKRSTRERAVAQGCGTVACIAGHIAALATGSCDLLSEENLSQWDSYVNLATEWLEIDYDDALALCLFAGSHQGLDVWDATPEEAALALDELRAGRPVWDEVRRLRRVAEESE